MSKLSAPEKHPELCQIENAQAAGPLRRPGWCYTPMRVIQELRRGGISIALLRALGRWKHHTARTPPNRTPDEADFVLNLQPGELVEVKTIEEIEKTLDPQGRHRGLVFTPEMRKHCGNRYRVFKRLELMFDEYHKSQRRLKNTVLLESVFCEGAGLGCDRSCFLYWREAWLRRVDPKPLLGHRSEIASSSSVTASERH